MKPLKILSINVGDIYPPNYGGAVAIYYRLKELRKKGHIVSCLLPEPTEEKFKQELEIDFDNIFYLKRKNKFISLLRYIPSSSSYISSKFKLSKYEINALSDFIFSIKPDVIIYESAHCMGIYKQLRYFISGLEAKEVYFSSDIEYHLAWVFFKSLKWNEIRKIISYIDYVKLKKNEPKFINKFEFIFSISDVEKNIIEKINKKASIIWIPPIIPDISSGDFLKNQTIDDNYKSLNSFDFKILFAGHLGSPHNIVGIKWFFDKVLPLLRKKVNACFILAGKSPGNDVIKMAKDNTFVFLFQDVASMSPFMQIADIVIVPLFGENGIKIKLIEALKYSKKVVARPEALVGSGLQDIVPNSGTPEGFADICLDIFFKKVNYENIWGYFNDLYNTEKIIEKIEKELELFVFKKI
ncbi:MAG: glycosyltransferase [Candidatus Acididesulfobacter diazotrophicus]|jgi:hypothetical protein|uniref:Glycosyltransferase n=1 Tax=Candidatus Acididesulfobacter diazotrophicus TaxID=2597226 RepID=A0A519BK17_9DELT|nr:MAG: glycosyltransferase [Candidatus Acididesulfobacter diazotrophicus]